jgi:hypothetical protein
MALAIVFAGGGAISIFPAKGGGPKPGADHPSSAESGVLAPWGIEICLPCAFDRVLFRVMLDHRVPVGG